MHVCSRGTTSTQKPQHCCKQNRVRWSPNHTWQDWMNATCHVRYHFDTEPIQRRLQHSPTGRRGRHRRRSWRRRHAKLEPQIGIFEVHLHTLRRILCCWQRDGRFDRAQWADRFVEQLHQRPVAHACSCVCHASRQPCMPGCGYVLCCGGCCLVDEANRFAFVDSGRTRRRDSLYGIAVPCERHLPPAWPIGCDGTDWTVQRGMGRTAAGWEPREDGRHGRMG